MIFVGDIALPSMINPEIIPKSRIKEGIPVIANLEGPIVTHENESIEKKICFNSEKVVDFLIECGVKIVSLANNHMFDIPGSIKYTKDQLEKNNILNFGAGKSFEDASKMLLFDINGNKIIFLAFGWEVIGCKPANRNSEGVNSLKVQHVFNSVKRARKRYPNDYVVIFMHWGYELEKYPLPMHRQLAHELIDIGVNAIIGCHSHCIQGVEIYKESPIVYGLGNWYFPQKVYFNGRISFPPYSYDQLAFEWVPWENNKMVCHHYRYVPEPNHRVEFVSSDQLSSSSLIKNTTPYAGMPHKEYIRWFKKNRIKRKILPIYKNFNDIAGNWFRDRFNSVRDHAINALISLKVK